MKNALLIEPSDIKKLLAEKYNVSEDKVIKTQYSYTVILESEVDKDANITEGS